MGRSLNSLGLGHLLEACKVHAVSWKLTKGGSEFFWRGPMSWCIGRLAFQVTDGHYRSGYQIKPQLAIILCRFHCLFHKREAIKVESSMPRSLWIRICKCRQLGHPVNAKLINYKIYLFQRSIAMSGNLLCISSLDESDQEHTNDCLQRSDFCWIPYWLVSTKRFQIFKAAASFG